MTRPWSIIPIYGAVLCLALLYVFHLATPRAIGDQAAPGGQLVWNGVLAASSATALVAVVLPVRHAMTAKTVEAGAASTLACQVTIWCGSVIAMEGHRMSTIFLTAGVAAACFTRAAAAMFERRRIIATSHSLALIQDPEPQA